LNSAQTETDAAQLEALQNSCTSSRDEAVTASQATATAYVTAVSVQDTQLVPAVGPISTKQAAIASLKASCDQALSDVDQYTETQVQLDAKQRVVDACTSVDGAQTTANSAISTSSTLTSGATTTVQAILDLSDSAAAHV